MGISGPVQSLAVLLEFYRLPASQPPPSQPPPHQHRIKTRTLSQHLSPAFANPSLGTYEYVTTHLIHIPNPTLSINILPYRLHNLLLTLRHGQHNRAIDLHALALLGHFIQRRAAKDPEAFVDFGEEVLQVVAKVRFECQLWRWLDYRSVGRVMVGVSRKEGGCLYGLGVHTHELSSCGREHPPGLAG